ncbi:MAG TPA: hypothetical protein VFC33_15805 [Acidimicrobiia bacterium]|nr:hypothetical protein [Acidimicrobiia bacterium]
MATYVATNQVQPGKPFLFEADAADPGSNDYMVEFEQATDTSTRRLCRALHGYAIREPESGHACV